MANRAQPRARGGDWIASWRLTRRQLEQVARGELPTAWIAWARRDLATLVDPARWFVSRTSRRHTVKGKR
jgi:hypothetical protein